MKLKRTAMLLLPPAAIVLEALPWGVVLNFMNPYGDPFRETYSYFSLTPFGYANVFPLITAILTCVLAVLGFISILRHGKKLIIAERIIAAAATVLSLGPLMFGISYFSPIGAAVTLLLAADFVLTL